MSKEDSGAGAGGPEKPYAARRVPRAEQILIRGLRTHLTWWGSSANPIVCLHGYLDTSDTFQFLVDEFESDPALVAPDWRGFGESAWSGIAYWFADYLADLDQLLEQVCPNQPVTLIGHSMGGNVATLYAGIRPERVRAVVSLEGFGLAPTSPDAAPGRYAKWLAEERAPTGYRTYPSQEAFAAQLVRHNPRLSPDRAAYLARRSTRPAPGGGCVFKADPARRRVNPVLYRREEAQACWRACTAPVLMVLGGHSTLRASLGGLVSAEQLSRDFRNLELLLLPEAGHMVHHDEARACARRIEEFLKQVAGRPGPA